jgi:hypothetical protein
MSYKIEIQNNFFVVTDTTTGIEEIREVRDQVKWRVSGSIYSFFYNIPNLVDQNSPNIIRLGENAKEFDFSEIVDSTETPFASREIFNDLLNVNLGKIIQLTEATWGFITGDINDQTDLQTILNSKFDVPTGDTTQYIAGDGTLITFPVAGQAGTLVREVKNRTGATLTKGTIVYINGANGNKPTVDKALATSDATSAQTFGFLQTNIANNAVGYAVVMGDLIGLDTSGITEGTQLYLSSTVAGEYTTTKQVAPAHMVYVGIVTRSHATLGQIEVKIQNGYELDELHDVLISGQTDGQVLQFEGASGLWKNKTLETGLTVGSTAISSGTDGRVLFQNGGVLQQSANLFWDNTNSRLGIGTSSPSARLHILAQGALSTDIAFRVTNTANSEEYITVAGNGAINIQNLNVVRSTNNQIQLNWQLNQVAGNSIVVSRSNYGVGNSIRFSSAGLWSPSGAGVSNFTGFSFTDTIAQSGTSTGISRGLYINPTLTSAFDWRSIEWTNNTGFGLYGSGDAVNYLKSKLGIGTTTPTAKLDVTAQGALSTDLAFRIRNSANTADWFKIDGTGAIVLSNSLGVGVPILTFGKINAGSGYFYADASSYLTWSTQLKIDGTLLLANGINCQGYGKNFSMNYGTITGGSSMSMVGPASISLRPDFNLATVENSTSLFIAPNSTANPTKKLIKLMDSTLTNTFFAVNGNGQTSIGTNSPNASAKVQIDSTTQGFLPPRMTNAERTAIASPAVGLMVYCTDAVEGLYIYKSMGWTFVI